MDRFRDVTVEVGAKELTLDIKDFSTQVVAPALSAIAQAIDQDLLAVGIQMAAKSATVSAKTEHYRYRRSRKSARYVERTVAEQTSCIAGRDQVQV